MVLRATACPDKAVELGYVHLPGIGARRDDMAPEGKGDCGYFKAYTYTWKPMDARTSMALVFPESINTRVSMGFQV